MVIVVPEIDQYKLMNKELRYKTVQNLNLLQIASLVKKYPYEEIQKGVEKATELLAWVINKSYDDPKKIKNLAKCQVKEFWENVDAIISLYAIEKNSKSA